MDLNSSFGIFNKKRMNITNLDYIQLKKDLEIKRLLNHTPVYYFLNLLINILLLIICFWLIFYFNNWNVTTLMSFPIAFFGMQLSYLGHDAGHMAISKNRKINDLLGHFSHSFFLGGSFSYWKFKHNKHHANPNHEEMDPDINNDPFSFSERKAKQRVGLSRLITRYQSFLLPPVFLIMLFMMRYDSLKYMLKNRKGIIIDVLLVLGHVAFFLVVIPYFIGFLKAVVLYLIVSVVLGLYFGFSFIPNHIGMPVLTGKENLSFLEEQVITSRDIKSGRFLDLIFGGLNYQIEHHLFPSIPRKNLSKIKLIVKEFCIKKNINYKDDTLAKAWNDIFIYLSDIGKHAKKFNVVKTATDMV